MSVNFHILVHFGNFHSLPTTAGLERERYGKYTVQVHRRGISCAAETDQCEYDPS